jgi:predicted HTH transcriptional regulator
VDEHAGGKKRERVYVSRTGTEMNAAELVDIISRGESGKVQFKERMPHATSMAYEIIAFANSEGGIIIFGVNDKTGHLNGLSFTETASLNSQLVNIASNNILPPIFIKTETISVNGHNLVVVTIPEGTGKPYKDRSGCIYMKNGSDKRKVTSNEELARLLQTGRAIFADEMPVHGSSISNIDMDRFKTFVKKRYEKSLSDFDIPLERILENLNLAKNGMLTLAGLLLFGENRHTLRPVFSMQCIAVDDDVITGDRWSDTESPIEGTLDVIFDRAMGFIDRNMRKIPETEGFNSPKKWEIPRRVFEEFIINALIHRDYFISSPVKVFVFQNRIEIISPGKLPNSLTVDNIKNGVSIVRNPVLYSNARDVLPYIGLGTGIPRAFSLYPNGIVIENITEPELLKVIIRRNV